MFRVCHVVVIVVWEACTGGGGFQLHISKHQRKERREEEGAYAFLSHGAVTTKDFGEEV